MTSVSQASGLAWSFRTRLGGAVFLSSACPLARMPNSSLTSRANIGGIKPLKATPVSFSGEIVRCRPVRHHLTIKGPLGDHGTAPEVAAPVPSNNGTMQVPSYSYLIEIKIVLAGMEWPRAGGV